ncbi:MAG: hypothetical protein IKI15_02355 [Lachnospiraceae bacterium]|nr:hypothetical protein [Lachnospiraceae bacterium]
MEDSKKLFKIILILVIILLVYIGGCFGYKQAKFAPYEKSAENFKKNYQNEAFRKENPNTMVDVSRSGDPFTPRGTLTVVKDRVQLNIHPGLFGGFTTDVTLTDKFGGATVAQFSVDEKGELIGSDYRTEYNSYRDEIMEALKLANETFGDIYQLP